MYKLYEILTTINNIQIILLALCCLLCFVFFERLSAAHKIFSYYLFLLLVIGFTANEMTHERLNNLPLLHIMVIGEFAILSLYFKSILKKEYFFIKKFKWYLILFGGLIMANSLFVQGLFAFNSNGKSLMQAITIGWSVAYLFQNLEVSKNDLAANKSLKLINSSLLFYNAGSFFIFLFYQFILENKQLYNQKIFLTYGIIYLIFTILVLIAYMMLIFSKKQTLVAVESEQ